MGAAVVFNGSSSSSSSSGSGSPVAARHLQPLSVLPAAALRLLHRQPLTVTTSSTASRCCTASGWVYCLPATACAAWAHLT